MTEEGYPIYLRAKPFRGSSRRVPAEHRLPKRGEKKKEEKPSNSHPDFIKQLK